MAWRVVTDKQWAAIKQHLPRPRRSRQSGRPPLKARRFCEGILWSRAPWSELTKRRDSESAVHRSLKPSTQTGALLALWRVFLNQLSDQQKGPWDWCFIDGRFIRAKTGAIGREA